MKNSKHVKECWSECKDNESKCVNCLTTEEELEFWKECYNGLHNSPDDCPTYYDGCNCGGALVQEVERLEKENEELKKVLKVIYEADALSSWAHHSDDDDLLSIASMLRGVYRKYRLSRNEI